MKSKILFSTLVMATAFSACTQEDIAVNNENASMEAVGAKLLASGISINSGEVANSRVAVENGIPTFTKGDKAAVAWTVKNGSSVATDQSGVKISELSNNLFANHMLVHNGEKFESRGNIYEGWHFAYRPFQYMARPAQLEVVVNDSTPLVESNLDVDWYLNGPMFSNALFLSDENVDVENGMVTANMPLYFVHNTIRPELNVDKKFTDNELLKKIAIKSITLDAGEDNKLFTESFKVKPTGLKDIAEKDAKGNAKNDTIDETYFGKAFEATLDYKVITTIGNTAEYNLGKEKNTVRMFLAPTKNAQNVEVEDLSFRIDVAGGHFDVVYTPEKDGDGKDVELTAVQKANNEGLTKLLYRLQGKTDAVYNPSGRDLTKLWVKKDGKKSQIPAQTISMSLALENFTADYLIEDSTDWNGCVALANALRKGNEVPTFTLAPGANVIFDETIAVPENGVEVVGSGAFTEKITIKGKVTWPTNIKNLGDGVNVVVDAAGELNVEGDLWASRIYNYGTIKAGASSKIGEKGRFTNEGRVIVEYGAYVYPTEGKEGIIAYNVPANETAARINTLINGGTNNKVAANVNTLIIENGVVLDLTPIAGGTTEGDRYNNNTTADETKYPTLDKVNVELNKGTIKSTEVVSVKNLTLAGEGNTVSNINVLGDLTIEAGTNTIVAESVAGDATIKGGETTITGVKFAQDVTVDAGTVTMNDVNIDGELASKGIVTVAGEAAEIGSIVNDGTLNANTDIVVATIAVNSNATANVATGKTIWYTVPQAQGGYVQEGTTKGRILYYGAAQFLADLNAAEDGETVTLNSDVTLDEVLTIEKNITLDLNGKNLTLSSQVNNPQTDDIVVKSGAELKMTNGNLATKNTAIYSEGAKVSLDEVNIVSDNPNAALVYCKGGTLNIEGGSIKNVLSNDNEDKYIVWIIDGCTATLNTEVSGSNGGVTVKKSKLNITGGTYSAEVHHGVCVIASTVDYVNATIVNGKVLGTENSTVNGSPVAPGTALN